MNSEEKLRQEAIRLYLQDVPISAIAAQLSRTRQWVYKWISRYQSSNGQVNWYEDLSKAPLINPNKVCKSIENSIVQVRKQLSSKPYSQQGAVSIMYELRTLGVKPPSISTINRVLKKHNLIKKEKPRTSHSREYPDNYINVQQMDLIGPRYLKGGFKFYIFTIIDIENHFAGIYPIRNKAASSITPCVADFWVQYQKSDFLQMDNELSFKGSNRHPRGLGLLLRMAISNHVTPVFIPPAEPWRNGVVEKFNDTVKKYFLKQPFATFEDMQAEAKNFVLFHNANHRYSSQNNKSANEMVADMKTLSKLEGEIDFTQRAVIEEGQLIFIRFIRSDLKLSVLNSEFIVSKELVYSYVEAVIQIEKHFLAVYHKGRVYHHFEFAMPLS